MATASFYIRKNGTTATIAFRFSYKRGVPPFRKSINEQIPVDAWDEKKQRVKDKVSTTGFAPNINRRLDKIRKTFEDETKGVSISKAFLERLWISVDDKKGMTFSEFMESHYEFCKTAINPRTRRPYSERTLKNYHSAKSALQGYVLKKGDITFRDLNDDFHRSFIDYLEKEGYANNTMGKYLGDIKTFAKDAAKNYPVHPFILSDDFFLPSNETSSVYASEEEIRKIFEWETDKEYLRNVRNWFIIGCWTGLRVSDWWRVGKIDKDYITIKPEKTQNTSGKTVVIPVHHHIKEIIKKYGMPREISDVKFNKWIKDVFKAVGITHKVHGSKKESIGKDENDHEIMRKKTGLFPKYQLISSHTCRRSFATNNYLMGIDTLTIMNITGHTTEKSFLKYIKVTPTQHAERLKEKWDEYYSQNQ